MSKEKASVTWGSVTMEPEDELATLRAERDALAERLRLQPSVREIVSELREIKRLMMDKQVLNSIVRITDLLRQLDESQ